MDNFSARIMEVRYCYWQPSFQTKPDYSRLFLMVMCEVIAVSYIFFEQDDSELYKAAYLL